MLSNSFPEGQYTTMGPLHFLPGQRFDCSSCAKCCRSAWQVAVDEPSRKRMVELPVENGLVQASNGAWVTGKRDGACAFLTERNLCGVHAELGAAAKPHTCRQFPFHYQDTPDGVYVGVSFYCTAVQRNEGRALEAHEAELRALLAEAPAPRRTRKLTLKPGSWVEWPTYRALEGLLASREALARAVLLLSQAPEGELSEAGLREILGLPLPEDPMLAWMETSFVAGLVARVEGVALQDILDNRPVLCGQVTPGAVQESMAAGSPPWLAEGLERYRAALLFRKFLLSGERALLENMLVLHLVLRVGEVYAWASALTRGQISPADEDFYTALDRCELDLLTHGEEAFTMSGTFWTAFLNRISA